MNGCRTKRGQLCALGLVLMAAACAGGSSTDDVTDSTTTLTAETATTSSTLQPLTVGAIEQWVDAEVDTVCVSSEQTYPQVAGYRYDVEGLVTRLLAPSGVTVVQTGEPCNATLLVTMHLEGRSADYGYIGIRFSGMFRTFDATLEIDGFAPLTFHHETDLQPGSLATDLDPQTPEDFLVYYEHVWTSLSIDALVSFLGPVVAIELLPGPEHGPAYSTLCDFGQFELGSCPTSDVNVWRAWYADLIA